MDMPVHADVKDLLTVMDEFFRKESGRRGFDDAGVQDAQAEWLRISAMEAYELSVVLPKHVGNTRQRQTYMHLREVSRRLNENRSWLWGMDCKRCGHANIVKKGQRFISNSASLMNTDFASVSACVAITAGCLLITGDGSIQMNLQA